MLPTKLSINLFEFLFFVLVGLFFLSLGSDQKAHLFLRYGYGFFVFILYFIFFKPKKIYFKKLTLWIFAAFVFYEYVRFFLLKLGADPQSQYGLQAHYYFLGTLRWTYFLACFFLGYQLFYYRACVGRFYQFLVAMGFLLAVVAIPPLMHRPGFPPIYTWNEGGVVQSTFFPSFVYVFPWVSKYLVEKFAHVNYIGDVMAVGFFSSLGLMVYHFELFRTQWREEQMRGSSRIPVELLQPFFLFLTAGLTITAAIFLLLSRGTILCLSLTFFAFLFFILLRFRSKTYMNLIVTMIVMLVAFNLWAGNLTKAWNELQTLSRENSSDQVTSFSTNKEGARRALGMRRDYSLWGVGTGAYKNFSQQYAVEKPTSGQFNFADHESMNHYLQVLAEEGVGAYLYFLFLVVYFIEVFGKLFKVKSRFQFILALALVSWVFMVFLHSSFNHLLERVSMSALTSVLMGVSLGLLRDDFDKLVKP